MPQTDMYDYDCTAESIKGVGIPYENGNFIVFTAKNNARFVGIVFDFEDYNTIHPFKIHKLTDADGNTTASWFFYLLERPHNCNKINYRLVIDGLWTVDPENPVTIFDDKTGIRLSQCSLKTIDHAVTEPQNNGLTKFICKAPSGEKIRLGGTFTNWDSWIYEMKEVKPGQYEIDLPLPAGTYYYTYYTGLSSFIDNSNPLKGYTTDGRTASCIIVK